MKAQDVMTKDPICLESSTDIMDAAQLFHEKRITSVRQHNDG